MNAMPISAQVAFQQIAAKVVGELVAGSYARAAAIPMLAHYTTLGAFESILQSRQFWLSCVRDMNDISEVSLGFDVILGALKQQGESTFKSVPFRQLDAEDRLNAFRPILENESYSLSLCEHGSDEETDRLVMWQTYGKGDAALCMVLRKVRVLGQTAAGRFPVHWVPMEYDTGQQLAARLQTMLARLDHIFRESGELMREVPPAALGQLVAGAVVTLVVSHKHPAFRQEREMRFIRSQLLQVTPPPADAAVRDIVRQGKSKKVFVLPLRDYPEFGIHASLSDLLDHVIIGPSDAQPATATKVRGLLDAAGLSAVSVRLSEIPYRDNR